MNDELKQKLKVVVYKWKDGLLHIGEFFVATLEIALILVEMVACSIYKIFDKNGCVIHSHNECNDNDQYACYA